MFKQDIIGMSSSFSHVSVMQRMSRLCSLKMSFTISTLFLIEHTFSVATFNLVLSGDEFRCRKALSIGVLKGCKGGDMVEDGLFLFVSGLGEVSQIEGLGG